MSDNIIEEIHINRSGRPPLGAGIHGKSPMIFARIAESDRSKLLQIARNRGQKISELVREILQNFLKEN